MRLLERAMQNDLDDDIRHCFIPYIQLHEFEGLLFSSIDVFKQLIPDEQLVGKDELISVIERYSNPEMINTSKENSPSHRLERIISGYDKVVYGDIIAETIGLATIRTKCPRFNEWIEKLEKINKNHKFVR